MAAQPDRTNIDRQAELRKQSRRVKSQAKVAIHDGWFEDEADRARLRP
jgi:hypothetical protein